MGPKINGNADIAPHVFCSEIHMVYLDEAFQVNPDMRICIQPCGFSNTAGPVFFVHSACWQLAQMLEPKPSYDDLYNLGLQLREIMPRDCFKPPNPRHLASFASASTLADSEWKALLLDCAQLPVEIQDRILSYANADKITFALLTGLTTSSLGIVSSSAVSPHPDGISNLVDNYQPKAAHLYASFVNIFGVDYLHHVEILNAPVPCDHLNRRGARVDNIDQICGIEFNLGLIGVSAIRFHMTDGSKTAWLGSVVRGWRCGPLDVSLRDISLLKNVSNLVKGET